MARGLLGKYIVINDRVARIVETEAYSGIHDKASHAGTKRKETCFPMWGVGGFTYVYLTYGMHCMFNVTAGEEGRPAAVLIRAVEPVKGVVFATNGPGRLTRALGMDKSFNNVDLVTSADLYVAEDFEDHRRVKIVRAKRIGVDYAQEYKDKLWRFYIAGNKYVSKY